MDFNAIKDLINTMDNSGLDYLKVNWQGIEVVMKKNGEPSEQLLSKEEGSTTAITSKGKEIVEAPVQFAKTVNVTEEKIEVPEKNTVIDDVNIAVIKSPIVGTFYAKPAPDKEAFVMVGSKVKKGDVLCVIEAMKLMNEIESEVNGEVVDILVSNEQMVEYGQPLFKIK